MSRNFRQVTFNRSEFSFDILVLNIRYVYFRSQSSNLFYLFDNKLDFVLAYYFVKSEITKYNIDKFLSNLLMKLITKKLLYYNINKWIEKLSNIS